MNQLTILKSQNGPCLTEMRSVKNNAHGKTTNSTSNRDGHDPGEHKETDTLPVDSLDGTVAKTNTNSSTSDAHGCRDGKGVL